MSNRGEAHLELNAFRRKHDCALVISGDSLEVSQPKHSELLIRPVLGGANLKQEEPSSCREFEQNSTEIFANACVCVCFQVCLRYYEHEFVELACQCPAVVCCRCSPTQKAQIVRLLQQHTANRTCAIGQLSLPFQHFIQP